MRRINEIHATGVILYPLKTPENQEFYFFKGVISITVRSKIGERDKGIPAYYIGVFEITYCLKVFFIKAWLKGSIFQLENIMHATYS